MSKQIEHPLCMLQRAYSYQQVLLVCRMPIFWKTKQRWHINLTGVVTISVFTLVNYIQISSLLSTSEMSKESISKFLIGSRFQVKLRILSPEICTQFLRVKGWKATDRAKKANKLKTKMNKSEHKLRTDFFSLESVCFLLLCSLSYFHL